MVYRPFLTVAYADRIVAIIICMGRELISRRYNQKVWLEKLARCGFVFLRVSGAKLIGVSILRTFSVQGFPRKSSVAALEQCPAGVPLWSGIGFFYLLFLMISGLKLCCLLTFGKGSISCVHLFMEQLN